MNRYLTTLLLLGVLASCGPQPKKADLDPPVARQIEELLIAHGDTRIDFYYWMNDRTNPEVIAYLEAENDYREAMMVHTEDLQETLFSEMQARVPQDDESPAFLRNGYYYYTRFEAGGEYPIYCRRKGSMDAPEEILINVNKLAEPHPYFGVRGYNISPDNRMMAFTYDTVGRRQFTIMVKDLETGEMKPTGIQNAGGDVVWAADNATLFFSTIDPVTLRYDRVNRFKTDVGGAPEEVYYEGDETFRVSVSSSKDNRFLMINIQSTLSSETRILETTNPMGSFRVFQARQPDLLYRVFPYRDRFYVLTNLNALNFRLMHTPLHATSRTSWRETISHRADVLLENVEVFDDFLVLQERSLGLRQMRIIHQGSGEEHYLEFDEEAYTASIGVNAEMASTVLRYNYTSLTTPNSTYDYDMVNRTSTLIKQQEVPGGFDARLYETRRLYVPARDGINVPLTIVYRKGMETDGQNPLLLYGYGSYGSSADPRFSTNILSLLDRGFIYAIAHIRGGQDLGRQWYEDGKLLRKKNTFYDFIDCGRYLVEQGYTNPEVMFASGGSAGGLLVGAVVNMAPELFKGVIAAVPFVDVVTTMLDETIPLTTEEYDEWGNPNIPEYYSYMLSYSPYDNVTYQAYPNLYVTSGLHDSQVQYWEPTKWVAKLRQYHMGDQVIFLDTNMEAGHGGASGRYRRLREVARQYAFILDLAGVR
jgi:oligopeptidase B